MNYRLLAGCVLLVLTGCQPQQKYEWGGYANGLLAYYKDPTERADFDKLIDQTITKGEKSHKVPPGLYAEAGYEALSHGDTGKAIDYFNKEKAAWPESVVFMDKAIAETGKPAAPKQSQSPTS